ncbi:G protein-activated inward rectifier potassium channel 3 isoform X1 [Drosophila pseudoobscura]|uniref:G protein-activated inward rectifier potassium channel 3 isoform X1 n=1 Tax=Drosophila pseudoobscura pseudoobscura TaxID=46245 RepID=A0A6I8VAD6_DROPS|nr:G protein-activated inward rectifier potassium channel 3 isoform X1 [Drosophila pseudoobscura]XP_015037104.2 G protein-activated inward rectifier potassium channel 3 isoform X1 [Drosophila pseudoobscura]
MIVDKSDLVGENAWTKLLPEGDKGKTPIIAKMGNSNNNETSVHPETTQLSVDQLVLATTPGVVSETASGGPVLEEGYKRSATYASNINSTGGESSGSGTQLSRKESILGTFHRQIRRSIKAVSESPGQLNRYRQTRFSSRRVRKRVVFKHGECNVVQGNVAKRRRRYLQDIFTTLVDAQWRWTLLVFAASFVISWAFFGFIWWIIAYAHNDLEYINLRDKQPDLVANMTHTVCVTEVKSIMTAFLYSVETQTTIGYGNRYVTEECPEAIFTMCIQCITGVFIQAFMVGIVFAKLSRPKKRAQTLLFSRNAVICHRDGVPCLMFRVGDMRKSHIIEAHIRAQIIRKKVTKEGEVLPFYQQELHIGADGGEDRLMFIWPTTIVHKIDRNSPLYMLSASDMLKERFEVVVMLEGVIESTGMTTQARSSYLPSEVLWGHRFVNVVSFRKETGEYEVDYTLFNNTYDVDTPLCSAKQLDELKSEYSKSAKSCLGAAPFPDRALSASLFQRIASAASVDHLDPASDESLDSGRLQIRSHSIPNGVLASELEPLNNNKHGASFTMGGLTITTTAPSIPNLSSINEKTNSGNSINSSNYSNNNSLSTLAIGSGSGSGSGNGGAPATSPSNGSIRKSNPRRLSIKQDQLPIDSIC